MTPTLLISLVRILAVGAAVMTLPASLYLGVLALASRRRRPGFAASEADARITVLIPAHDEERVLGDTLAAVEAIPRTSLHVRVVVVADNCTDSTEDVARRHGATVLRRDDPDNPGKGPALDWALSRPEVLDATDYVFLLDADSLPERNSIAVAVARAREHGADIVQLPFLSRGKDRSDRSAMNVWTTTLMNRVRPRGLAALGLPCRLQGGGILLNAKTARTHGWPARGLSEDLVATVAFLDAEASIAYEDGAVVWARAAETDAAATIQRVRWESGRLRATRLLPRLVRDAVVRRSPEHAAVAAHLAVPPLTVHVAVLVVGVAGAVVSGSRSIAIHAVSSVLTGLYLVEGLRVMQDRELAVRALAAAPRFALWKMRVQWKALRRFRELGWDRTPRDEM